MSQTHCNLIYHLELTFAIAIAFTPGMARITRSVALSVRRQDFVNAAIARGEGGYHILVREILPNAWPPLIVETSLRITFAILLGSALSFGLTAIPITILCLIFETPTLAGMANGWVQIAYAGLLSTGVAYTLQAVGQSEPNPIYQRFVARRIAEAAGDALLLPAIAYGDAWTAEGLLGDNTDGQGLLNDLQQRHGLCLGGKRILLLGAGGATRGVLLPLLAAKPSTLVIANRTSERALALAKVFADKAHTTLLSGCGLDALPHLVTTQGAFDVVDRKSVV